MKNLFVLMAALTSFVLFSGMACAPKSKSENRAEVAPSVTPNLPGWGKAIEQNQPGINQIESEFAPGAITKLCDDAIAANKKALDAIGALPAKSRTFENVGLAFEDANAILGDVTNPLTFMKYVSTVKTTQDEGGLCEEKIAQYSVSIFTRKDLYDALSAVKTTKPVGKRLREKLLIAFERNGLKLPEAQAAKVKELRTQLEKLQTDFSDNLNKDNSTVELSREALSGVPEDFINRLAKSADGTKFVVTTKSTDYQMVVRNATNPDTRRQLLVKYWNRAAEKNTPLLKQAIALRKEIATLMGYDSWLSFQVADRMAKNRKTVEGFLDNLKSKLALRNKQELARILAAKKEANPAATGLDVWDLEFYRNQIKKKEYDLDDEVVRNYFPSHLVVKGIFDVYSKLLGVKFTEVPNAKVWNSDVKLYRIDDAKSGKTIGGFYTDLVPRPGKYGHAAAFTIIAGRNLDNNKNYMHPTSAIVANLTPPANGKPSLLTHEEVETFFHEFGHIMHQTLTKAPYSTVSGSNVSQDFVEAPSQMLENWVYDGQVLALISGHYQDETKKLPKEILQKILAAKDFNQGGYYYTRQLVFGLLDTDYHTAKGDIEPSPVFAKTFKELIGLDVPAETNFPASFGHLMGGYDAGYYGYLWSEVYADDMFTRFEKAGLLSPKEGMRYRTLILEKGNTKENMDMLKDFLGRAPSNAAFFKKLHI